MTKLNSLIGVLIFSGFIAVGALSSCGTNPSSQVSLSMNPEHPVLILSDLKRSDSNPNDNVDDALTIAAPWFTFGFTFTNNSDKTVTIVGLTYSVSYLQNGKLVTSAESSFDIEDASYIAQLAPGASFTASNWIIYGLDDSVANNTSVTANLKFLGWFGDFTNPEARFEKRGTLSTR